ncbi:MAG: oxygenase MpaB family protein [Cyclobacteriaceae bacterium]|nr:oxygenase MpaB family protein [Cyclobacteriaceae bacterium]
MIATSTKFLDSQRLVGDVEADTLIQSTFAAHQQGILYGLFKLEENAIESQPDSELKKFLTTRKQKPTWFNDKRLQNGQKLFKQYALEMMALLGAMSLPYCYAASPGNKALYLSDKIRNSLGKRLMDTASFIISVLTPGTLEDGETGHIHINKVRLIHAMSRYYLKKLPSWNMEWGVPINQEDMAGTNMAFSYVILLGIQQSGFILSQKEKEDFLFAWRYIGYQMNIDEALFPSTFLEARQLATTIKIRNFKKTEEGIILTKELLSYYKVSVPADQADLVASQIRFYLGNEVAEYIGVTSDPIRDRLATSVSTFKSLQSMLSVQPDSYQKMLSQHTLLKKKFEG